MRRLVAVLTLAGLTACGGGASSGTGKADYLRHAEAICKQANTDAKAHTFPTSSDALPAYVDALVSVADAATKKLAALTPPAADKDELQTKVLGPLEDQVAQGKSYASHLHAAVAAHDQKTLQSLLGNPPTGAKADLAWMRTYGFSDCVTAADTSR